MPTRACAGPPAAASASTSPATAKAVTPIRSRRSTMRASPNGVADVVDDDVTAVDDPGGAGQTGELVAHGRGVERAALARPREEVPGRVVRARAAAVEDHVRDVLALEVGQLPR